MGNRIKLTEPSSSYIGRITKVTTVTTGKWPDYEFTVENGDVVQVPQSAADRQITRLDVGGANGLVGELVKFSRSAEPGANGKLFHNLDLVNPVDAAPKPATAAQKRVASPHVGGAKEQPFDAPARSEVGMSAPPNAPLHGEDDEPTPALTGKSAVEQVQREALEEAYAALYGRCVVYQARSSNEKDMPFDGASVNAMAASVWLTWKDQGLLRGIASDAAQRHAESAS